PRLGVRRPHRRGAGRAGARIGADVPGPGRGGADSGEWARAVTDLLFYGDTERSAAMRHELPVGIGDPFLVAIVDGRMHVMASPLERARIAAAAPDAVIHDMADLGLYDLLGNGMPMHELDLELASRAAAAMG